jgi:hypothetical protein
MMQHSTETHMQQQHQQACSPTANTYTPPMAGWDMNTDTKPSPFSMTNGPAGYPHFITTASSHPHQGYHTIPANPYQFYTSENINHQPKWPSA